MPRPLSRKQLRTVLAAACIVTCAGNAVRADDTPVDYLQVNAKHCQTFVDGDSTVVYVDSPLTIQTDRVTLSAKSAVIWFTPVQGAALGRQRAEIALIGDAELVQDDVTRTGQRLFVSTVVGGSVRLSVEQREAVDLRGSDAFRIASDMRPATLVGTDVRNNVLVAEPTPDEAPSTQPTTGPTTLPFAKSPVFFSGGSIQTTRNTPDEKIAVVIRGNVLLTQRTKTGDYIEMQADQAVLFTTLSQFADITNGDAEVANAVVSAYLDGDVRITFTPATRAGRQTGEQRLRAKNAFYEFNTNRAVLTKVVLQTNDPKIPVPITMRANVAKQLSLGEYKAEHVTLTTSQFATPSYSVNASKAYVRQYADADPAIGNRTAFQAKNATFRTFGVPIFYFPYAAGDIATNAFPLRGVSLNSSRSAGFGVQTTWGLFESFGKLPPPGVDAQYHLDYYTDRGPAAGLDAKYKGGELANTTKGAWNFQGDFTSYLIQDKGVDNLGRDRARIDPEDDLRGRIQWQHQHILPDDWQVQLRAGLVSDATFLPEWYQQDFDNGLPTNLSAYAKHQTNTEALTLLLEFQPNNLVTTADGLQNRFIGNRDEFLGNDTNGNPLFSNSLTDRPFEVDRLPEIGYYRIGESFDNDTLTFFSENRFGGYRMNQSDAEYGPQAFQDNENYGFRYQAENLRRGTNGRYALPGIPSLGFTGTTEDYVIRGDFRQEVDYPIDAGRFKVVPYVLGRYTGYSDSPQDDPENRLLGGVGMRVNTSFWKVDDAAHSDLFDVNRVRHVVEPELNLFASAASVDRNDVYIYDDEIDNVNDISAVSFFIRQRWQTKRGAPGLYRSVDFLTLNVGVIGFANTPSEPRNYDRDYARATNRLDEDDFGPTSAKNFRGLFFQSTPEASIPRSSLQGDASWRISDTTLLLGDASWNIEEQDLSTAAVGTLVGRGDRVSYYAGLRYIGGIDSTIASFTTTYQISAKYTLNFGVAVDLARDAKGGNASIVRRFDRFLIGVGGYYDQTDNESGLTIAFYPEGLAGGVNSNQLQTFQR